jgi:hypothetical protein
VIHPQSAGSNLGVTYQIGASASHLRGCNRGPIMPIRSSTWVELGVGYLYSKLNFYATWRTTG